MINNSIKALAFFCLIVIGLYACRIKGCQDVPVPACAPPTQLTTAAITDTTITVKWNAPEGVNTFEVSIKSVDLYGESAQVFPPVITNETTHTFTGLTPNTLYEVQVKSICGTQTSSPASIQERTYTIIIVDIISQRSLSKPGEPIIGGVCNFLSVDTSTLTWTPNQNELLRLELRNFNDNTLVSKLVIQKSYNTSINQYRFNVFNDDIICDDRIRFDTLNPPVSVTYTSSTNARLVGSNYAIDLSITGVSIQNSSQVISGKMYR